MDHPGFNYHMRSNVSGKYISFTRGMPGDCEEQKE